MGIEKKIDMECEGQSIKVIVYTWGNNCLSIYVECPLNYGKHGEKCHCEDKKYCGYVIDLPMRWENVFK